MKYLLPLFFIKFLVHTTDPSLVVPGNYYIKMCIATLTENQTLYKNFQSEAIR